MAQLPLPAPLDNELAQQRAAHHARLAGELVELRDKARAGGGEVGHLRQRARNKLLVDERVAQLLDEGAPFLPLGQLAGITRSTPAAPGAGLVTGIGRVSGKLCVVIANDASLKGGCYFPETVKKHLRAQEIALRNRLPCIYLVDSGGIFLPEQARTFADAEHFGRIFANQARMSALGIVQLAVVLGLCTAGGAYVPAMADENIVVRGQSTIYLAGPPLVAAATGEQVDEETLGGALMHSQVAGTADHIVDSEQEALALCRQLVGDLPEGAAARLPSAQRAACAPRGRIEDLLSEWPSELRVQAPMRKLLACLLDDSEFVEFRPLYGPQLICGTGYIEGMHVGILANDGILFGQAAQKGAHFINLCNQRGTPLIFVQHIAGFMVGTRAEHGGIAKDGAKMVQAVACARVPKVTLIVGASHGAGNYAMCGRGFAPNFLFTWPQSKVSVMGAEQAADVLAHVRASADAEEKARARAALLAQFEAQMSAYHATSEGWDDGIILPEETRQTLALAISAATSAPLEPVRAPVFRL